MIKAIFTFILKAIALFFIVSFAAYTLFVAMPEKDLRAIVIWVLLVGSFIAYRKRDRHTASA